tara:strand:+ start:1119 stop:1496 length:378 start_codon:yes stop_codon:yes gene_type:complete
MNKNNIKLKVLSRSWTFTEISNLKDTIEILCEEIYNESKLIERFELVRELKLNEGLVGYSFEDAFREAVKIQLRGEIAEVISEMLGQATISFEGGNKNEISEGSVGGESHQERTTDEKKNSKNKK